MEYTQNISLRQRMLDLPLGASFSVIYGESRENTLRSYASSIKELTGRKFKVMKDRDVKLTVFRYE